jgi:hypothetical protein
MNVHLVNPETNLPATLIDQGLEVARRIEDAFCEIEGLHHMNVSDRSIMAPQIGTLGFVGRGRFVICVIDPHRLYRIPLERLRRESVARELTAHTSHSVRLLSAEHIQQLFKVDTTRAQAVVMYSIDLQPQVAPVVKLPDRVELPDRLWLDNALHLGQSAIGELIVSRQEFKAAIIAGAQRSGKSSMLKSIAYQALQKSWSVYIAEPADGNSFNPEVWNVIPGVQLPVADSAAGIKKICQHIAEECLRRSKLFKEIAAEFNQLTPTDIEAYNALAVQVGKPQLQPIVLIIDEFNTFADEVGSSVEDLTRRMIKYGVMTLLAGHNWHAADIPKSLSSLFETRLIFRVNDPEIGRVLLRAAPRGVAAQAAHIDRPGRAVMFVAGRAQLVQAYSISDDRILALRQTNQSMTAVVDDDQLSSEEIAIITIAQQKLEGDFTVRRLWPLVQSAVDVHISSDQLRALLRRWEMTGLLVRDLGATTAPRRASKKLLSLMPPETARLEAI